MGTNYSLASLSKHILVIGRSMIFVLVFKRTTRTRPLLSGKVSRTLPSIHNPRGAVESATMTRSPGTKLLFSWFHF